MNLFASLETRLKAHLSALVEAGRLPEGLPLDRVTVEPPRDASHGDFATNAAMVLAKPAKTNPRALAEDLVTEIAGWDEIASAEIAGPGFINMRAEPAAWHALLKGILEGGDAFGDSARGQGAPVNVEYVSANPTGPLHLGHARGAVVGDVMAALLAKVGFAVTREYYINDAGAQVDVLGRTAYARYREVLGETITLEEGQYPGEYMIDIAKAIVAQDGDKWLSAPEAEWLPAFRAFSIDYNMGEVRRTLGEMNIDQLFVSERGIVETGGVERAIGKLTDLGLMYRGVLEPPKGKKPDDWEEREQLLFRSTDFGDDVDRPLQKSDGSYTYFANDIAYHYDKHQRGFAEQIDVWGEDHKGYIKRMQAAVAGVTDKQAALEVIICNIVKVFKNGEPVKLSKRAGNIVTLESMVNEIGASALRFIMLTRRNNEVLEFDIAEVTAATKDNPVFYVQYAHARISSALRKAVEVFTDSRIDDSSLCDAEFAHLQAREEQRLISAVAQFPRIIESAALAREPHRVAFYLSDLAGAIHGLWAAGNVNPAQRIVVDDDLPLTQARLALIRAAQITLATGLRLLGVVPVEELRRNEQELF
ncbi:MAG: arginine--tRNA ligase [Alphaproteobacteria bacterium]